MTHEEKLVLALGQLITNSKRLAIKGLTPAAINRIFRLKIHDKKWEKWCIYNEEISIKIEYSSVYNQLKES